MFRMQHKYAITFIRLMSVALLVGGCSGSIGSACDSQNEATTTRSCSEANGRNVVDACLTAANADGRCASASTGDYHYTYLFKQAIATGKAGAYEGGKPGYEMAGKAMRILQSIANDPHAPIVVKLESQRLVKTMIASGKFDASGHPIVRAGRR